MASRLGIIGGGNMGGAIVRGAIESGVLQPDEILVVDISDEQRKALAALGCPTSADPADALACEQMMLAVKPQVFPAVGKAIGELRQSKIVMSIMAGLSSPSIRAQLGRNARVVRIMPNTPCSVGAGMAGIALGEGAQEGDEALAVELFSTIAETVQVDESLMHAVTAVSGSGPAYVFLLAEAMQNAAVELGLDADAARLLARQTVYGAGELLRSSDMEAAELRQAVTSPGGTTEAALRVMMTDNDLLGIVERALAAARDRGVELDRDSTQ